MSLASLYNLSNDPIVMSRWSFNNADGHTRINQRIHDLFNINLTYFVLDPITAQRDQFLQSHQQAHNEINAVLGIVGNDLTDVNFDNPSQLRAWIFLHYQEHQQANLKLRI